MVVIDSFKALRDFLGDASAMRTFVYDLAVHVSTWGAVSLFVGEYTPDEMALLPEFAIADGIIRLSNRRQELRAIREVEVLKLRGADFVTGGHFFEIGPDGLEFFPRVRGPEGALRGAGDARRAGADRRRRARRDAGRRPAAGERDGGPGGTGTGKTLLGLQFLLEGARNGEPGIHFALEETAEPAPAASRSGLGWDLRPFEEQRPADPQLRSPPSSCRPIASSIEPGARWSGSGARRAVLDSLTSMALGVPSERRFKELVYAITKHFRVAGVTLNMNMEIADLLGSGAALGPRGLVRRRQRRPAQVRGGRRSPGARDLGPQGARRPPRHRRAPAQDRRGPDRRRIGVRGAARGADGTARAVGERQFMTIETALYDIAQLLESADGAAARVRRVLELLSAPRAVRPVRAARGRHRAGAARRAGAGDAARRRWAAAPRKRCWLSSASSSTSPPPPSTSPLRAGGNHLAVPLVGLDEVIGLLLVRSSTVYTEQHLRALSVVAAMLAAYFITLRDRTELTLSPASATKPGAPPRPRTAPRTIPAAALARAQDAAGRGPRLRAGLARGGRRSPGAHPRDRRARTQPPGAGRARRGDPRPGLRRDGGAPSGGGRSAARGRWGRGDGKAGRCSRIARRSRSRGPRGHRGRARSPRRLGHRPRHGARGAGGPRTTADRTCCCSAIFRRAVTTRTS